MSLKSFNQELAKQPVVYKENVEALLNPNSEGLNQEGIKEFFHKAIKNVKAVFSKGVYVNDITVNKQKMRNTLRQLSDYLKANPYKEYVILTNQNSEYAETLVGGDTELDKLTKGLINNIETTSKHMNKPNANFDDISDDMIDFIDFFNSSIKSTYRSKMSMYFPYHMLRYNVVTGVKVSKKGEAEISFLSLNKDDYYEMFVGRHAIKSGDKIIIRDLKKAVDNLIKIMELTEVKYQLKDGKAHNMTAVMLLEYLDTANYIVDKLGYALLSSIKVMFKNDKIDFNIENLKEDEEIIDADDLKTATDEAKEQVEENMVSGEKPKEITMLNPIEADQAVEIANNHGEVKEFTGVTDYKALTEIANEIDETESKADERLDLNKKLGQLEVSKESLELGYTLTGFRPSKIVLEAEESEESTYLLQAEYSAMRQHSNREVWSTIKTDFEAIRKLIEKSVAVIESKKASTEDIITTLPNNVLRQDTISLKESLPLFDSLRDFVDHDNNNGDLSSLVDRLTSILDINSPILTQKDTTILSKLKGTESGTFNDVQAHIKDALVKDPISVNFANIAKDGLSGYKVYFNLTGTKEINVVDGIFKKSIETKNQFDTFNIPNTMDKQKEIIDKIVSTLSKFPTEYNKAMELLSKKYDTIEQYVLPLAVIGNSGTVDGTTINGTVDTLTAIKLYYIDFVKSRIMDKVNSYYVLISIGKLLMQAKEKENETNN